VAGSQPQHLISAALKGVVDRNDVCFPAGRLRLGDHGLDVRRRLPVQGEQREKAHFTADAQQLAQT
jgi:hypothetical protein